MSLSFFDECIANNYYLNNPIRKIKECTAESECHTKMNGIERNSSQKL
jgi:hypothetical protein